MGRVFLVELEGRAYSCRYCDSPLALADDVLSRSFNCIRGRAYLFNNAFLKQTKSTIFHLPQDYPKGTETGLPKRVNVSVGPEEERMMISGMHTVADIFCCCCGQILGWKYLAAHDKAQKYKEGKFVLERWRITEEVTNEFNLEAHSGSSDAENA